MSVEGNVAYRREPDTFSEKMLIPYYRGLSGQKGIFYFLGPQNGSKDLPNFSHESRGQ